MAHNKKSNKQGAAGKTDAAAKRGGMNSDGNPQNLQNVGNETTDI